MNFSGKKMSDFKTINPTELEQMLQQGSICLVDVRTEAEIQQGKIGNGHEMPLHELPMHIDQLDKAETVVFYCKMGVRSAQAAAFAVDRGFEQVYNLQGGITAWVHAGLPVGES